jgi:hypothetical protein
VADERVKLSRLGLPRLNGGTMAECIGALTGALNQHYEGKSVQMPRYLAQRSGFGFHS